MRLQIFHNHDHLYLLGSEIVWVPAICVQQKVSWQLGAKDTTGDDERVPEVRFIVEQRHCVPIVQHVNSFEHQVDAHYLVPM